MCFALEWKCKSLHFKELDQKAIYVNKEYQVFFLNHRSQHIGHSKKNIEFMILNAHQKAH